MRQAARGSMGDVMKRTMNDSRAKVAFMPSRTSSRACVDREPWCWIAVCVCEPRTIISRASAANRRGEAHCSCTWHFLARCGEGAGMLELVLCWRSTPLE